ncbi:MAG: DUF6036 family nucleotidyltransferase [Phycisphaerae bacterium]
MNLQKDLKEFIALLDSARVKYVIVGGYAVAFHGHPRYTGDIDVFVEVSEQNASELEQALKKFGFQSPDLAADAFRKPDTIVQLGLPPDRIDLITSIAGVRFDEAWEARITTVIDGVQMHFLGKPLLLRNKKAVGRPKDRSETEALTSDEPRIHDRRRNPRRLPA